MGVLVTLRPARAVSMGMKDGAPVKVLTSSRHASPDL